MAYLIPETPPPGARLIAAYDTPRRTLHERGISLRAAPDLTGFRRYLAARQRAEEMSAAEEAISAGLKLKRRRGLLRGQPIEAVDPQLRPVSWAVALRGDRRDIEDAWDHRGKQAHAYVLNGPSDAPAVCGYRPPMRRHAGARMAALAPASMETNEQCRSCLVLLYERVLRGEVESGPWPSADTAESRIVDERAEAPTAEPVAAAAGQSELDDQPLTYATGAGEVDVARDDQELLAVAEPAAEYATGLEIPVESQADEYVTADSDAAAQLESPSEPPAYGAVAGTDAEGYPLAAGDDIAHAEELALTEHASAAEPGWAQLDAVTIPIGEQAATEDEEQLELAAGQLNIEVEEFGESQLAFAGESADALTNLLELGAEDVLVVAAAGQTALIIGGVGRGADWAGTVLDMEHEPVLSRIWGSDRPVYRDGADVQRIFGPFWARHAVLVPVGQATCVVFGSSHGLEADELALWDAAREAVQRFQRPTLENALADEREVGIALQRMMDAPDSSFEAALEHVLTTTAGVLGCSLAAGVARMGRNLAMRAIDLDGADHLDPGQLLGSGPLLSGEQRVSVEESLVAGNQSMPAVVSRLRLPLHGDSLQGLLVLTHTVHRPRGFTSQDHRLAEAIAPAAVLVLERAGFGEGMRALEAHIRTAPATDPLTGLPNQAAWEEALNMEADRLARNGGSAAVAAFRIAGLRRIDERRGPLARDAALREAAELLRRVSRSTDLAARVGEDEFRILVRDGGRLGARKLATRVRRAAREARESDPELPPLAISFANARSRPQLLAASRLVGQRLRRTASERQQPVSARPH